MAGAAPRPPPACGFLTIRRPFVDGAACSARSCRTCCLAWAFRSCVCCRAVARDSALLYKIGGGHNVCSISRGLRVKLRGTPFDFRPLDYKRTGAVNLKSWQSYCECHPKMYVATVPPLSFRDRRAVLIQDRVL